MGALSGIFGYLSQIFGGILNGLAVAAGGPGYWIAAGVLGFVGVGIWWYFQHVAQQAAAAATQAAQQDEINGNASNNQAGGNQIGPADQNTNNNANQNPDGNKPDVPPGT